MRWSDVVEFVPILLKGAGISVFITISCLLLSTALGLVWALLKMSRFAAVRRAVATLINVVRGLPMIVLLFYIYFVFRASWALRSAIRHTLPRSFDRASSLSTQVNTRRRNRSEWERSRR